MRAEPEGAGYRLSGEKTFVVDGHVADTQIVAARTSGEPNGRDGITLFLVDADRWARLGGYARHSHGGHFVGAMTRVTSPSRARAGIGL
jgi:alkylation response protein AidB-like acyl-CoA dehydrogenase